MAWLHDRATRVSASEARCDGSEDVEMGLGSSAVGNWVVVVLLDTSVSASEARCDGIWDVESDAVGHGWAGGWGRGGAGVLVGRAVR